MRWSRTSCPNTCDSKPEADQLIDTIQASNDRAERVKQFHALQRIGKEDLPVLQLFEIEHFTVNNKRLHGLGAEPDAAIASLKNVWLQCVVACCGALRGALQPVLAKGIVMIAPVHTANAIFADPKSACIM